MGSFADAITDGLLPALIEVHGESVTYTTPAGAASSITAIWQEDPSDDRQDEQGEQSEQRARVLIQQADLAAPLYHATVTRDGEAWVVTGWRAVPGGWELVCERAVPLSRTRPKYRQT